MPYTSSLTDHEWDIIEPLLPPRKKTRPPKWSTRDLLDDIFYQLKNGCNWVSLHKDLHQYFGILNIGVKTESLTLSWPHSIVMFENRSKKRQWTTPILIDSQAVKNTCNAGVESKEFCSYKATNGIKRHLAVDILGFPFFTHCTKASVSDDRDLIEMLCANLDYFKGKPVSIPQITILVDRGYHLNSIIKAFQAIYPGIMRKIRFEHSAKPSKAEKKAQGQSGFVVVKARWVIECSNAWMVRCKSLLKNCERTLSHATAKLNRCFIRLTLKRLAVS